MAYIAPRSLEDSASASVPSDPLLDCHWISLGGLPSTILHMPTLLPYSVHATAKVTDGDRDIP